MFNVGVCDRGVNVVGEYCEMLHMCARHLGVWGKGVYQVRMGARLVR